MKQISEFMEEITKAAMQQQEKMLIDDVINIYNGKYKDYSFYIGEKEALNKLIEKQTQKEMTICLRPLCLAEPIFNYIKNKGEEMKNDTTGNNENHARAN